MKKILNNVDIIGIDTNVFIYYLNKNSRFHETAENLFTIFIKNEILIITTILTLTELLSFKAPIKILKDLEAEILQIPFLSLMEVNHGIATLAAEIRRKYGFRLADAIQLATATEEEAKVFITNDQKLKKFKELKVVLVDEV